MSLVMAMLMIHHNTCLHMLLIKFPFLRCWLLLDYIGRKWNILDPGSLYRVILYEIG